MMSDVKALTGKRVLIIEDDYYQSRDEVLSIERAGGTVVASTGDAGQACAYIDSGSIDFALVDINLGYGAEFQTARSLRDRGIPFVFATGYDAEIVPEDFQDVTLIRKPFSQSSLISALALIA